MPEPVVLTEVDARGVATLALNRPEVFNAYNGEMIDALIEAGSRLAADPKVRVVVIKGRGKHFQAGADVNWLKEAASYPPERNLDASIRTTTAMRGLHDLPKPTVALVHGACFGGGTGLVACCDVAIAADDARFGITEVRIGVVPAPIALYMIGALGLREARRYVLTGERFGPEVARHIGLVHEVVPRERLEARGEEVVNELLLGGPTAIARSKASLIALAGMKMDDAALRRFAEEAAAQRASAEAGEGLSAFLEKRRPAWAP
ncbi:MAG: enoyl-CoA hydratase/isomerase family protein [Proteobacteria bacterium]|nr:enoyl-CoA hydratase/isomerase family protein [Pseudomonadota bacterium]